MEYSKPEKKKPDLSQKAVALRYDPTDAAPKVVAKGQGYVAERILENAKDIPVYQDKALVEDLTKLDLGQNIPPELYEVVAQILVFVDDLDRLEAKLQHDKPDKTNKREIR